MHRYIVLVFHMGYDRLLIVVQEVVEAYAVNPADFLNNDLFHGKRVPLKMLLEYINLSSLWSGVYSWYMLVLFSSFFAFLTLQPS